MAQITYEPLTDLDETLAPTTAELRARAKCHLINAPVPQQNLSVIEPIARRPAVVSCPPLPVGGG